MIGLLALMALMVVIMFNDVRKPVQSTGLEYILS